MKPNSDVDGRRLARSEGLHSASSGYYKADANRGECMYYGIGGLVIAIIVVLVLFR